MKKKFRALTPEDLKNMTKKEFEEYQKEWQALSEEERNRIMIANELLSERKKYNLSRNEVCKKLSIPYRTLQNWENGDNTPPEYVRNMYKYSLKDIQPRYFILEKNSPESIVYASEYTIDDVKLYFLEDLKECDNKEELEYYEEYNRKIKSSSNIDEIMDVLEEYACGMAVPYKIINVDEFFGE